MEGLKKLEQIQRAILLMQSRGVIDSSNTNSHSDRFLADFLLLLLQPCGDLSMDLKCCLISEFSSKISATLLEEASAWLSGKGDEPIETAAPIYCDRAMDCISLLNSAKETAKIQLDDREAGCISLLSSAKEAVMIQLDDREAGCISLLTSTKETAIQLDDREAGCISLLTSAKETAIQLDAMRRANSTIEDFLDRLNEKLLQLPTSEQLALQNRSDVEGNGSWMVNLVELFERDPLRPLIVLLADYGLLTDRIRKELGFGEEYWALERKLCCALTSKSKISTEDVMRAMQFKSFDYRVLNLLLYQLREEKVNELHMEFLSISEFLVEIADDLFDYEDDVMENNFNILRMFVRIYGTSAAPAMLAKCISEAEQEYERLVKALDPELWHSYRRRCEEATKEGGKNSGPSLGTWNIPPIIQDEDLYRSDVLKAKSQLCDIK